VRVTTKLVLIVEDDTLSLTLTRDLLQLGGFRTVEATSAEEGVKLAHSEHPDLILMDIQLPGMDGIAALRELRNDSVTSGIPVVAVTASVMTADRERFSSAGFDGLMEKPVDATAFARDVGMFCERGRKT
jgi:two-component system cell cycle response regulator DivK